MRYRHVCIEALAHRLPPHVVTSDEIEDRLRPVYERLRLPAGRLELMTGIRERRFFDRYTKPGTVSAYTTNVAIEKSGIPREQFGALIHGSVSRDQMEPATANAVHHAANLPNDALVLDVSNACLGLLNGIVMIADMIELGRIRAGVVVGTETGRDLVENTIDSLLADETLTRQSIKSEFASLTIGSGSAAVVLCHEDLSQTGHRLLGGAYRTNTKHAELCAGGEAASIPPLAKGVPEGDAPQDQPATAIRPRMQTDSEALLHAGVDLAAETWPLAKSELGWSNADVDHIITHQVGRAHSRLMLERLDLDSTKDAPTVETLGNTGAAALPTAWSIAVETGTIRPNSDTALLGIGSGLNCLMLGVRWH